MDVKPRKFHCFRFRLSSNRFLTPTARNSPLTSLYATKLYVLVKAIKLCNSSAHREYHGEHRVTVWPVTLFWTHSQEHSRVANWKNTANEIITIFVCIQKLNLTFRNRLHKIYFELKNRQRNEEKQHRRQLKPFTEFCLMKKNKIKNKQKLTQSIVQKQCFLIVAHTLKWEANERALQSDMHQ